MEASAEEPHRTVPEAPVTRTMVVEASDLRGDLVGEPALVEELVSVEELALAVSLDFRPQTSERSTSKTVMAASATRIM